MKADQGLTPNAADENAHHSTVAGFTDSLNTYLRGMPADTALPEQLETAVRQVDRVAAAGTPPDREHLAEHFTQAATSIGVSVHSATTADWLDVVSELLRSHRVGSVAVPQSGDGFFEAEALERLRQCLTADGIAARSGTDDETLFSVDAAVTGVAAAIAEAGTLVCESQSVVARGSSLIPPVHVAIVAVSQLLPDLYDYFELLSARPQLPGNISLITGPSKTADIEGVLVTGVHGPGEVHVVLVREV